MNRAIWKILLLVFVLAPSAARAQTEPADDHAHGMAESAHDEGSHAADGQEYAAPRNESMVLWLLRSLGWRYGLGLAFLGSVSFALSLLVVIRGGPYAGSALVFLVAMPLLFGLMGVIDGLMGSFTVMAHSSSAPKASEIAEGVSLSLVSAMAGIWAAAPAFLVATIGLLVRTLVGSRTAA